MGRHLLTKRGIRELEAWVPCHDAPLAVLDRGFAAVCTVGSILGGSAVQSMAQPTHFVLEKATWVTNILRCFIICLDCWRHDLCEMQQTHNLICLVCV